MLISRETAAGKPTDAHMQQKSVSDGKYRAPGIWSRNPGRKENNGAVCCVENIAPESPREEMQSRMLAPLGE